MATTLSNYLTQTQRILHDANNVIWSQGELTDYINEARVQTASDLKCLRSLQTVQYNTVNTLTLTAGTEYYTYTTIQLNPATIDVINITVIYGNTRYPLFWMPFTKFNAFLRYITVYQQRPEAWSDYGQLDFFVGPIPDQNYAVEIDTCITPANLVALSDQETIAAQFQGPVQYYAAYKAKLRQNKSGEADYLKDKYMQRCMEVMGQASIRKLPSPYEGIM